MPGWVASSWGDLAAVAAEAFAPLGLDLSALALAWARVLPTIAIVPAFGLRALPPAARAVFGLALAASFAPVLAPVTSKTPWPLALLEEVARGTPVAIAAAVPIWAATMAGGLVDNLRAGPDVSGGAVVHGRTTPLGLACSLLAGAMFLEAGGAGRVVEALARPASPGSPVAAAAHDLAAGTTFAVAVASPVLAAAAIVEMAAALIARTASPAQVNALLASVRALAILFVTAQLFGRLAAVLGRAVVTPL